ncbi:hypothetical protein, partial [Shewanella chilikensis]|uniref:hypothetical protein n=1 Tax=Shewanella chilikensis TaxID=558541 RepID=UPI001F43BC21
IIFDIDTSKTLTIEEFAEYVKYVNLEKEDEISSLAPQLKMLANNEEWLENFILNGLDNPNSFQIDNAYSSQSYILCPLGDRAFLRFAIWAPLTFGKQLDEGNFYSYGTAHNHDFSLLTAGYLGPGYKTSLYELKNKIIGYPGEDIKLDYKGDTQLLKGRVILYEAGKDIHIQHQPEELSVSLNLIVAQPQFNIQQLYYDVNKSKVSGFVANAQVKRGVFFRFAAALNNKKSKDILSEISQSHSSDITRLYAYKALYEATKDIETLSSRMANDKSEIVNKSIPTLELGVKNLNVWG